MKSTGLSLRSIAGSSVLAACMLAGFPAASSGSRAFGQQRGPEQRVVQGKVVNGSDAAMNGAVVYLKDDHSLSVKSYITAADGTYRFGQLAQSTDYELWAESNGKKSPVKTISSFDSKNRFFIDLKIK
jgi:hypothetical protein